MFVGRELSISPTAPQCPDAPFCGNEFSASWSQRRKWLHRAMAMGKTFPLLAALSVDVPAPRFGSPRIHPVSDVGRQGTPAAAEAQCHDDEHPGDRRHMSRFSGLRVTEIF